MTKRLAFLVLLATVLAAAAIAVIPSASALENEPISLPPRSTVEGDYGPIPAPDPASVTVGGVVGPAECAALPSCDLLPIDIEAPTDAKPGDDFYVVIEVAFDAPSGTEDVDVFFFDDGQTHENEGGDGSVYTQKGSSASADNPERIQVYEPLLGRYNLVVQNFAGAAVTWHLRAASIVGVFTSPIESLAPPPGGGTTNPSNKPTTTTTTRPPTTTAAPLTTTVSIPDGVVLPDDDFESGDFDPDTALDRLAADEDALTALASGRGGDADSPSAASLVLWLVLFPLVLLVAGAALVASRRGRLRVRLSR